MGQFTDICIRLIGFRLILGIYFHLKSNINANELLAYIISFSDSDSLYKLFVCSRWHSRATLSC
ncbi:hypothetical protein BpHYR1_022159 [Brachionus plicatilis]|uniref:Uncharacterized protein n=1 Tax=Brachionus plicatilis TaxID=10195 RepID=A0A3M7SKV6_BRAPC|nr:hypothetical protein BpHYR1_022159 [Brachionus plicatilis]